MATIVPSKGVDWLLIREDFPTPFISLAVKGSKLETEIREDLKLFSCL
jgi:hypothetical protein